MTVFFDNGISTLYQADARQIPLPDQSVHCVVTSPPYFGLRVYRADSDALIGLEKTPEQWIASMLEVMAEVRRVLRDDGVLWVNLGDSYATGGDVGGGSPVDNRKLEYGRRGTDNDPVRGRNEATARTKTGILQGNLLGIPWRFALAMQDAGWILRSDIIWAKKSAMPESLNGTRWERCQTRTWADPDANPELRRDRQNGRDFGAPIVTDCTGCPKCADTDGYVLRQGSWRCTSSHEYIFQFVKGMGYYCDGEAVKTVSGGYHNSTFTEGKTGTNGLGRVSELPRLEAATANRRSVWRDIKPEPFGGEHYATFPSDLPRLCIQASTSEAGVCSECGAQWARVVEHKNMEINRTDWGDAAGNRTASSGTMTARAETKTLSWRPTCTCKTTKVPDKVPATVLDPFCGTATTCLAAMRLGRRSVGVDLSEDYLNMARRRLGGQTLPMAVL